MGANLGRFRGGKTSVGGATRFAEFATRLDWDDIPAGVVQAAKLQLLDTVGCGLATHGLGVANYAKPTMAEMGGRAEASTVGSSVQLPAANAAFTNGVLCHALDFDTTHPGSRCHISAVVVPTALAVAEAHAAGGRELLTALVCGNEIVARVGTAAVGAFHTRGFHPTSVCGVFGAAAAACRLSGFDAAATASCLGIAGSMSSGLFAFLDEGSPTKPIHAGWASHAGVVASMLAGNGATGPAGVFEGRFGFYHAYVGAENIDLRGQVDDLGTRWETLRIAYKPYPACHSMHGALGAALEAVTSAGVAPNEVDQIIVRVPSASVPLILEPAKAKIKPRTPYEAKFSLQYSVASLVVRGKVGVETYTEDAIRDGRVLDVARRVTYEVKEFATYPGAYPGGAEIQMMDGRLLAAELPHQLGSLENPMPSEEIRKKFRANASFALADAQIAALEQAISDLEDRPSLAEVVAPLRLAVSSANVPLSVA